MRWEIAETSGFPRLRYSPPRARGDKQRITSSARDSAYLPICLGVGTAKRFADAGARANERLDGDLAKALFFVKMQIAPLANLARGGFASTRESTSSTRVRTESGGSREPARLCPSADRGSHTCP